MKIARSSLLDYVPASHEDQNNPGVLKKVLFTKKDICYGQVQMVNWALLPQGRSFQSHFHEDMDEVFVIVKGSVEVFVNDSRAVLLSGDSIVIPANAVHKMTNNSEGDVEYIVFGVSEEKDGKTVVVETC